MAKIGFTFFAYGILAISALSLVLYFSASVSGHEETGAPLLLLGSFIAVGFLGYMFLKLMMSKR